MGTFGEKARCAFKVILALIFIYSIGGVLVQTDYLFHAAFMPHIIGISYAVIVVSVSFLMIRYIKNQVHIILSIISMTLLTRLAAVFFWGNVSLQSDYQFYFTTARDIAEKGLAALPPNAFISVFPHTFGYIFTLSCFFKLFGASLWAAQIFNMLLSVLISVLIFLICKNIFSSPRFSFISALAWVFAPSQALSCILPMTEYLYIFYLLCCILIFIYIFKLFDRRKFYPLLPLLGITLALLNSVRPMAIIFIIAAAIYLLLSAPAGWIKKVCSLAVILIVFQLSSSSWLAFVGNAVKIEPAKKYTSGWSLFLGLNKNTDGAWNMEDSEIIGDLFKQGLPSEQIQKTLFDKVISERIFDKNPIEYATLFLKKINILTSTDHDVVNWMNDDPNNKNLIYISHYYYLFLLSLVLYEMLRSKKPFFLLLIIFNIGIVFTHMLLEVQPRYHFSFICIYCCLIGELNIIGDIKSIFTPKAPYVEDTGGSTVSADL